jgi:hydrogenase-4 component F
VHTWLPDAHAEAPTPVSALLSGALLATSFYAVLRYFQIAAGALGPAFGRHVLLAFGIASLLLAALYLLDQHDIKRLFAYSSVEHMGILAIGMSFASPLAVFGVLLHVLTHAAAKGSAFMGAGVFVRKYRTKELGQIRGGLTLLPWSGPLLLASVLALSASPPFGIFRSEFAIVAGGFADGGNAAAAMLVALVTVAFVGLAWAATRSLLQPGPRPGPGTDSDLYHPGEPSGWMVVPVVVALAALVLLGVHVPGPLAHLLTTAAAQLGVAS